jgi:hypothetical protein
MTDDELVETFRKNMWREVSGFVPNWIPHWKCRRFFENFSQHFADALRESRLDKAELKWAFQQVDVPGGLDNIRVHQVLYEIRGPLWSRLEIPAPPLPEKEFRPGSGQTIADGSNQDVIRVKPRRDKPDAKFEF